MFYTLQIQTFVSHLTVDEVSYFKNYDICFKTTTTKIKGHSNPLSDVACFPDLKSPVSLSPLSSCTSLRVSRRLRAESWVDSWLTLSSHSYDGLRPLSLSSQKVGKEGMMRKDCQKGLVRGTLELWWHKDSIRKTGKSPGV